MSIRLRVQNVQAQTPYTKWPLLLSVGLSAAVSALALWLMYPLAGPNAGHDFFLALAAASAVRDHQNPYDPFIIVRYAHASGIPLSALVTPANQPNQPYVYPPLLAWFLMPLTYLTSTQALAAWRLLSSAAILAGTYGLTAPWSAQSRLFSPRAHRILFAAVVLLAPVSVFGLYWGNPAALVYGALGVGVWALAYNHAWSDRAAGVLLSVTLLKPQLTLPLAALAALCFLQGTDAWQRRRRVLAGFLGATVLLVLLDLLATGPRLLLDWPGSILYLARFSNGQPDMPSLLGLFWTQLSRLPNAVYTLVGFMVLALTILVTTLLYLRLRHTWTPAALFGLLTVVWCFGTPYAHANDELLLVPAGLVLVIALYSFTRAALISRSRAGHPSEAWQAGDVVRAALAVFALPLLYLGGVVQFIHHHAHRLSTNVAAAIVPLALLIALGALMPSRTSTLLSACRRTVPPTQEPPEPQSLPAGAIVGAAAESRRRSQS